MPRRSAAIGHAAKSGTMIAMWPGARDHRVGLVGIALIRSSAVGMDVGDDGQLALAALRPELGEGVAVQNAYAAAVGVGVELVVVDDVRDFAPAVRLASEQEGAGLVPLAAAAFKLADDLRASGAHCR